MSTRKLLNPDKYRENVESVWVPKNCSDQYGKNGRMSVCTGTLLNPYEYRQKVESVRVPKNCPDQYEKMVESM